MAYLTPDDTVGTRQLCLSFPDGDDWEAVVTGCLIQLSEAENWEQFGDLTPPQAAEKFLLHLISFIERSICMEIGTIVMFGSDATPEGWLPCDGDVVSIDDYPELFAVIGESFGEQPTPSTFVLPDMRWKFPYGAAPGLVGIEGGESSVTLTVDEIPPHDHAEQGVVSGFVNGGLEAPAAVAQPSAATTGSTGSGNPHNNMPPYVTLGFIIRAR